MSLKPSEKAISEATEVWYKEGNAIRSALEAAYAIDVDPLLKEKDRKYDSLKLEIERLRKVADEIEAIARRREDIIANRMQRIAELEEELERLADFTQSRHPIGKVKAIGLMEAVEAAVQIIEELEAALRSQQDECSRFHKPA